MLALTGVLAIRGNRSSLDAGHMDSQDSSMYGVTGAQQRPHHSRRQGVKLGWYFTETEQQEVVSRGAEEGDPRRGGGRGGGRG